MNDEIYRKTVKQILLDAQTALVDHRADAVPLVWNMLEAALKVLDYSLAEARMAGRNEVMEMWYNREHQ